MSSDPSIAVIDDGELADVREILEDLGAEFVHWTKSGAPGDGRTPTRLLVTTDLHVLSCRLSRSGGHSKTRAVWIGVVNDEARTKRRFLLREGFDYVVQRPVHPSALRLLLQAALFHNDERRRQPRVVVGVRVSYRSRWIGRKATLVDLSLGGCRLYCARSLRKGDPVSVQLPGDLAGGRVFSLRGRVVRTGEAALEGGPEDQFVMGIRFEQTRRSPQRQLSELLGAFASGPAALTEPSKEKARERSQRRQHPRCVFEDEVLVCDVEERVLIGLDLSMSGMRVKAQDGFEAGECVCLAISRGPRREPVVIRARVVRNEKNTGLAFSFEDFEAGASEQLEAIVQSLPRIESLRDDGGEGHVPVTVSRLVPRRRSSDSK